MKTNSYDFIGDIHGHRAKLDALLSNLGYEPTGDTRRHPAGRRVVFLGDYVDRGPDVRGVLRTVRGMVEAGEALAILGNHEYNLICYHTPDDKGGWLRLHNDTNARQNSATHQSFAGHEEEFRDHLEWLKTLPCFLDLGAWRAVHACWDDKRLPLLPTGCLADKSFLRSSATRGTPEYKAVENVLKGAEVPLPNGMTYRDNEGNPRGTIRTRWWGLHGGITLTDLVMPPGSLISDEKALSGYVRRLPNYSADAPPVFFGHYWLPPSAPRAPLAKNLVCLDYGAGRNGPLTAYRWDGDPRLDPARFISSEPGELASKVA